MRASNALILGSALIAHTLLVGGIPSPWCVPDLTLVGLVLVVSRAPDRWLRYVAVVGVWTLIWAVRYPRLILLGYLGVGWIVQWSSRQWDVYNRRLQCVIVGLATGLMSLGLLWLEELWSLRLCGAVLLRISLTLLVTWCLFSLMPARADS